MDIRKPSARLTLMAAGALLLGALAVQFMQAEDGAPATGTAAPLSGVPVRFGPGILSDASPAPAASAVPTIEDTAAPDGLAVTVDQHLEVNRALKDVADYFLLGGRQGTRAEHLAALLAHLKAKLTPPASEEAERIVRAYAAYLDAHDALLARSHVPAVSPDSMLSAPDADRLAGWRRD